MSEILDEVARVAEIRDLHQRLLDAWNSRDAEEFASLFAADGTLAGFDGSTVDGDDEIRSHLEEIFDDHETESYVAAIRDVRFLHPDVALLRAEVGMLPPGQTDVDPDYNAVQVLIAVRHGEPWRIALFQNTPVAWHGRPEASASLTEELREIAREER